MCIHPGVKQCSPPVDTPPSDAKVARTGSLQLEMPDRLPLTDARVFLRSHTTELTTVPLQMSVSPVMGKGFPVDTVPADKVESMLIFATGSGISPIAALIDDGALDAANRKMVKLFYGAQDIDSMAFAERCALACQHATAMPHLAYARAPTYTWHTVWKR